MRLARSFLFLTLAALAGCSSAAGAADESFVTAFPEINMRHWYISHGWANGDYQACEWRKDALSVSDKTLQMTLSDRGGKTRPIGCAELHTKARFGYGVYEARMRSAAGAGLNTAFFTYIGPPNGVPQHDEIDFEFLGKDPRTVSVTVWTNGKPHGGKTVQLDFDASKEFHDYAFEWTPQKVRWYVDRKLVHETPDGTPLPSHPGMLYFSLWAGAPSKDDWLGHFSYTEPVTAEVKWTAYTAPDKPCAFPQSLKCK